MCVCSILLVLFVPTLVAVVFFLEMKIITPQILCKLEETVLNALLVKVEVGAMLKLLMS